MSTKILPWSLTFYCTTPSVTSNLALLLFAYKKAYVAPSLDKYLHMPHNAYFTYT